MKIMIVDDAAFMRMMLKDIITKKFSNVQIIEACNGKEAVDKYSSEKPDLVTMDITMPQMDGITAVKKIKEINGNAIIVMCSAMGQQVMVIEAVEAGAKDFIVKPFETTRVVDIIKKYIT